MGPRGTGALALPKKPVATGTLARLDAATVLLSRVRRATVTPTVIFDVDDTLFRTAHRSLRILAEWAEEAGYAEAMAAVPLSAVGYGIGPGLSLMDVPDQAWEGAFGYWRERFFTSAYVGCDQPYDGAVAYVQAVHGLGGRVVYLTGRHLAMEEGTVEALVAHGFPWRPEDGSTRLVLKPDQAMDDAIYKAGEFARLAADGEILGALDNEPGNVNLFHRLCPEAMAIFIANPHSAGAPPLEPRVYRIAGFPPADR